MGRGEIISHISDGKYNVKLIYAYRSRVEQKITKAQTNITAIEAQIVAVNAQIAAETDEKKKADLIIRRSVLNLQIKSLEKQIEYYQNNMPADPTQEAWCMDLTEDLTGNVGTAEIPGEPTVILIRPGYNNGAVYSAARDGQLMPPIAGEPNQVLFNWMLLPGWQRHKPIYRIGTITDIDYDANTCTVCLDPAYSSQQYLSAVDDLAIGDCGATSSYAAQINSFCERYPDHPFCTNTEEGSPITLSPSQMASLNQVNLSINANYGRQNDKSGFQIGDSWDVMAEGGSGDCEDFALTKMQALVDAGWNPKDLKIVGAKTRDGIGHAMLGVISANRGLVLLDVNYDQVMEQARLPYRIDQIAMTRNSWKHYTRKLEAVPVEYMTCNADAFTAGDRVVVEFPTKAWTDSKVIGFEENPSACIMNALVLGNDSFGPNDWSLFKYFFVADSWLGGSEIPGNSYWNTEDNPWIVRQYMFSSSRNNEILIFGGLDSLQEEYDPLEQDPTPECVPGGCQPEIYERCDKYTLANASWSSIQAMASGRAWGEAFKINSKHYVVAGATYLGGTNGGDVKSDNFEYDDLSNSWATKIDHPVGRYKSHAFQLGGIGFSFGGLSEILRPGVIPGMPDDFYGYNQATGIWTAYQDMLRGRDEMASGNINGDGYLFAGYVFEAASGDHQVSLMGTTGYVTRWVEKFNLAGDAWSNVAQLFGSDNWGNGAGVAECGAYGLGYLYRMDGQALSDYFSGWADFNALTGVATARKGIEDRYSSTQSSSYQSIR